MGNNTFILISIGLFFSLLILIVYIRKKFGEGIEIKNSDIILALLPILLWLLLSGKIASLQVGELKIETAFKKAKNESVSKQIYQLPITTIQGEDKSTLHKLEDMMRAKPQALKFVLGKEAYVPEIVTEYLRLLSTSTVKYIVFENKERQFIGLITLTELNNQIFNQTDNNHFTTTDLVKWLANEEVDKVKTIKGLLSVSDAITTTTAKQKALEQMEKLNSEVLPVLDSSRMLQGVVERSRLATSLLLEVSNSIDQ